MIEPPQSPHTLRDLSARAKADSDRLDSWKEIAAYLKCEVRTLQRWERSEGLPIRRLTSRKNGRVHAYKTDLDAWWNTRSAVSAAMEESEPSSKAKVPFKWPYLAASLALLLLALSAVWRYRGWTAQDHLRMIPSADPAFEQRVFANATGEGQGPTLIRTGEGSKHVVITPNRTAVYVTNNDSNTVSVIQTATNTVSHTLSVQRNPFSLAVSADGSHVFVGSQAGDVSIIDTRTKAIHTVFTAAPLSDIVPRRDGRQLYLANGFAGLNLLSVPTGRMTALHAGVAPVYLGLLPGGEQRLYISYQGGGPGGRNGHDSIEVFDLLSNRSVASIAGLQNVGGPIAVSPDGAQVWESGEDACKAPYYDHVGCPIVPGQVIHVIRSSDQIVLRTLGFAVGEASGISFFPDSSRAIVGGNSLKVIDTTSFATLETLAVPGSGAAFTPDSKRAYCAVQGGVAAFEVQSQPKPPRSLVGWWPGDGNASDIRGINHGSLRNGAAFAPGRVGQAFLLDRPGAFVVMNVDNLSSVATREFTVAAWVKFSLSASRFAKVALNPHPAAAPAILEYVSNQAVPGWRLSKSPDGHFAFCVSGAIPGGCGHGSKDLLSGRMTAAMGTWYHVAAARTATTTSLYVNGMLDGTAKASFDEIRGGELRIGSGAGAPLNGLVDEVQWYNRALTAGEIQFIYSVVR